MFYSCVAAMAKRATPKYYKQNKKYYNCSLENSTDIYLQSNIIPKGSDDSYFANFNPLCGQKATSF